MDDEKELATARESYDERLGLAQVAFSAWRAAVGAAVADWIVEQAKAHVTGEPDVSKEMGRDRVQDLKQSAVAMAEGSADVVAKALAGFTPELLVPSPGGYSGRVEKAESAPIARVGADLADVLKGYGFAPGQWRDWDWYDGTEKVTTQGGSFRVTTAVIDARKGYVRALDALRKADEGVKKIIDAQARASAADLWE
ncbi:hypothetical protein GCM10022239_10240 [Leifsonia bigeumensis]|uniref:Uncharacterized protein n=1 Tax=Leifsonella bigeumensis TaxID=433643 RepID=A0ABP7FFE7_9MICO